MPDNCLFLNITFLIGPDVQNSLYKVVLVKQWQSSDTVFSREEQRIIMLLLFSFRVVKLKKIETTWSFYSKISQNN